MYLYILLYLHNKFGGIKKITFFIQKKTHLTRCHKGLWVSGLNSSAILTGEVSAKCGASAILSAIR
jgi:hypothetical protein